MKKYLTLIICLVLFLLPTVAFGQTGDTESYSKLLQFLKGDGAFEKWFMEAFTKLDTTMAAQSAGAVMLGQAIGGFGALCYMGYLGWQMQEGARPWEVTPMIRPTIVAFILMYWGAFTSMIQYPLQSLAEPGIALFQDIEKDANDLRVERFKKQNQILEILIKTQAEEEAKQETLDKLEKKGDDSWFDIDVDKLLAPAKEWYMKMEFKIQKTLAEIIEAVSLTILRVCTYLIFFIQKIWSYVLLVLGPIAVGMSLIPGFENSFNNWVTKFININLYSFITYTVINIGQQLIMSGYQMELDRYALIIDSGGVADMNTLRVYVQNSGMMYTALFPCVAYIITGIGILMVPSIADSIVSAGGAGIMSKGKAAGGTVASVGRAATAAAVGGAAGAVTAAREIAKSVNKMNKK
ncbi:MULTISPECIES: type IV secretion system protein [unclassified Kaistella]|uniref:type IV secretion system protein n=1 Tax=unclassified Kaistella TaxID=2762626 RepID=UPI002734E989|nr:MULTISPECIES: type IV secretion system protein [unclassified Kaistella]MDP2455226.1 type IV secretion system protein [Kaistella sp. SH11-4b]MDP2458073.1 type IV secretion system protein [Kaistella sp. SH40-3]MDP2461040.1 type IV secretion system protein [Kaistella sp. SH19-2b]